MLACFTEFGFKDLKMDEQELENYQSKYLDLYEQTRTDRQKEKVSILDELDFELELIHRDDINVSYILSLLENVLLAQQKEKEKIKAHVKRILNTEIQLRSKKELIERFIAEHLESIPQGGNLRESFNSFWDVEKEKAVLELAESEGLENQGLADVIENYLFTEKAPLPDRVIAIVKTKPKLKERLSIANRVVEKIKEFVETYFDGVD